MRGYGESQKAYEKAKKDYKKKTGFSTVGEKMRSIGYTPPKNKDKDNKILQDLDEAQDKLDKQIQAKEKDSLNVSLGTTEQASRTTTDFINDLKDAYKAGLFTGGTKTKAFMDKYGLTGTDIVKLRTGIDQGLGQIMGKDRTNVLQEMVDDLRAEGILRTSGPGAEFLKQRASEIYEPGMKKSNVFLPFEEPQNILEKGANLVSQYNLLGNLASGIFGSSPAQRATYFGNLKGLEGEELDNFAAAVANDRNLYNQLMSTPEMQDYQLNEFRAEANKNAMAQRRRGDPDPISGNQGGGEGGSDDGTTDPGTDPNYTPPSQNFFTFFDPNLGRYRSGTYDEYLQYVTAKDGGIIQLSLGGNSEDPIAEKERFIRENKIINLRNILYFIEENKNARDENKSLRDELENVVPTTRDQMLVKNESQALLDEEARKLAEEDKLLGDMLKERFTDQEGITELSIQSGDAVKMAEEDQPAKGILNIELPSDLGPALREDLGFFGRLGDSGLSLLMEALRKSDISTGSANQFIEEALNNFVAAGIIPPNTSYDQLTDPFKDLVTREAAMIANSMATKQEMSNVDNTLNNLSGFVDDKVRIASLMNARNQSNQDEIDAKINQLLNRNNVDNTLNNLSGFGGRTGEFFLNAMKEAKNEKDARPGYGEEERSKTVADVIDPDSVLRYLFPFDEFPKSRKEIERELADGGIIGLKDGGMDDMMQADSLMFKDPSDEGQWEYNV